MAANFAKLPELLRKSRFSNTREQDLNESQRIVLVGGEIPATIYLTDKL